MVDQSKKRVVILAGPNGAGKTTFANEFLTDEGNHINFINGDLITASFAPFEPKPKVVAFRAGRLMLEQVARHIQKGESFAIETTLSGLGYVKRILHWQSIGYIVKLFFIKLVSPELAINRVHQRIHEGGHDVPEAIIRRRFRTGVKNFEELYKPIVNEWALYDNSDNKPILIEKGDKR